MKNDKFHKNKSNKTRKKFEDVDKEDGGKSVQKKYKREKYKYNPNDA